MAIQTETAGWQDYLKLIWRRKWAFLIPFVLCIFLGAGAIVVLPEIYEAQTVILVREQKLLNPLISGLAVSTTVSQRLRTMREEILAWSSLVQLIKELNLNEGDESPLTYERIVRRLRRDIAVGMKGNDIIVIGYQDEKPEQAQQLVNTLTNILIERNISAQNDEADTAIDFIEEQIKIYESKLEKSEEALREFKEVYAVQMPVASALNDQLVGLELQLTNLLIDNTEEHPAVKELRRQIESIKSRRNEEIRKVAESGQIDVDPRTYSEMSLSIPRQQQEMARLTRDYGISEGVYSHLKSRLEKARISQRLESSDDGTTFKVLDPARLPYEPVSPNVKRVMFLAVFVGLALGGGCAFLVEYLDNSYRDADEIRDDLELPALGSISKIVTVEDVQARRALWWKRLVTTISVIACVAAGIVASAFLI
ncbi:MAG: hypothetical protein JW937_05240 [Candidatus Omnitrophica bacterium]|nr:hypothetical protein [Candidatus Omnitrophota bacterium]